MSIITEKDSRPVAPTPVSPVPTARWEPTPGPGSGAPPFMLPRKGRHPVGGHSPY